MSFHFSPDDLLRLVLSAPIFLLAITLHEVAHGWACYRLGDDTAKRAGRLTLDPLAHLDPLGTIMFVFSSLAGVGFGWAKPVPMNPYLFRSLRRDSALTAIAGPLANLLQAIAWAVLLRVFIALPGLVPSGWQAGVATFLFLAVAINAALLCFNLLPIPPLDGSRVLPWLLNLRDPLLIDRLAPLGFIVLFIFVQTRLFYATFAPFFEGVLGALLPGLR
jgi:Zn-dependent protease